MRAPAAARILFLIEIEIPLRSGYNDIDYSLASASRKIDARARQILIGNSGIWRGSCNDVLLFACGEIKGLRVHDFLLLLD